MSFTVDAAERVARTVVQAVLGAVAAVVIGSGGWDAIDWTVVWKTGAFAGLAALLFALGAKQTGNPNDASFHPGGES
jgi:membrane protein implicated in regulation of membrane protease activity